MLVVDTPTVESAREGGETLCLSIFRLDIGDRVLGKAIQPGGTGPEQRCAAFREIIAPGAQIEARYPLARSTKRGFSTLLG